MTIFEKIVQDVDNINHLLDKYFNLVYKTVSATEPIHLTEEELLTKESIVTEIQSMINRLSNDIKKFSTTVCKSEMQRDLENRNLIDFGNGVRGCINRLERFSDRDSNLKGLSEMLAKKIQEFSDILQLYIKKSPYKIYTLQKAIRIGELEEKDLLKKFNL